MNPVVRNGIKKGKNTVSMLDVKFYQYNKHKENGRFLKSIHFLLTG
jgi:hypothetical protein